VIRFIERVEALMGGYPMKIAAMFVAATVALGAVVGTANAATKTIAQIVASDPNFSTLLTVATEAGFADELQEVYGLTVFAPTNAAFEKIPEDTLNALLADKEALRAVLLYHVVPGRVLSSQVPLRPQLAETLNGCERVKVDRTKGRVFVDEVRVKTADIRARNGIIHVIDSVLLPARGCPGLTPN
jgi:uncharacterized surface protein with fasciclin (FAS1) repeats